ncbi:MAG: 1-deoxy-D-xylulose-5-phosphate reductoisomerase [Gemmatimonadaceae bacterium]|nr:1-deoxy-D-xylulose-5-phosphate reductoisomerase [Gemmatimonadaceae bacterium]
MTIGVAILGATGSIGTSALRVLERQSQRFVPVALTAHENAAALAELATRWRPSFVGLVRGNAPPGTTWDTGADCLVRAATHPSADIVINAVVGAAGLPATLAALRAGRRVALANKETLVVAGDIVTAAAREFGGTLVPVDSEHSAILQCLAGRAPHEVRRLVLTASGGPFRTWSADRIATATSADALMHPTWRMGSKITIDSATLANKALEVIEAHHLFGVPYDRIEVVVHPQSIVHSFVEFIDGSVLAQLGAPSMELPILFALTWPERVADSGVPLFDPVALGSLTFEAVRTADFPMLELGLSAGRAGGAAPAVYNAANEAAVALFLAGRIRFGEIAVLVAGALADHVAEATVSLEALWRADASARHMVEAHGAMLAAKP